MSKLLKWQFLSVEKVLSNMTLISDSRVFTSDKVTDRVAIHHQIAWCNETAKDTTRDRFLLFTNKIKIIWFDSVWFVFM